MVTYRLTVSNQNEPVPFDVTHVIVEEGITTIKARAFKGREQLRSILFPQSLKEIGYCAFYHCTSLESLVIPRHVANLGPSAFDHCTALYEVIFEEGSKLKIIDKGTFSRCYSLKSIAIPKSVTALGMSVFVFCVTLEFITFEKGSQLGTIPRYCFLKCYMLKALVIPDAVTIIERNALDNCYHLASVYFSPQSNLQIIREKVFIDCKNLQFVNVPTTTTTTTTTTTVNLQLINDHEEAFHQCDALPITSTSLTPEQRDFWFKYGFDHLPLHQLCFNNIHALTQDKLNSIPINSPSLIQQDECGLTPLHIVCSNPQASIKVIKQLYKKHPEAATMISVNDMTPWRMYLVTKGVVVFHEFGAVSNGNDVYNYGGREEVQVSDITKALLREGATLNNIHSLIQLGLDYDIDDLYDATLALHGVSFDHECNRASENSGLYPFMTMAALIEYKLYHVYEMAMNTCVHNIKKEQRQNFVESNSM